MPQMTVSALNLNTNSTHQWLHDNGVSSSFVLNNLFITVHLPTGDVQAFAGDTIKSISGVISVVKAI